jgi:XTP/dITP diphosphohydrolase
MSTHRKLTEQNIVLASHNAGKLREVAALLGRIRHRQVVSAGDLGLPEPAETETPSSATPRSRRWLRPRPPACRRWPMTAASRSRRWAATPGVRTADWAEQPGGKRDYAMAMAKVAAGGAACRPCAWFTCALVLAWPDGHVEAFEGKVHGEWVHPPRGDPGLRLRPDVRPGWRQPRPSAKWIRR